VDKLNSVVYNETNPNPNAGIDPNLVKVPSPDYYTFIAGDISLDLTNLYDNCCATTDLEIHWIIEFENTPDPLNPSGPPLSHPDISGTGQPSTYGSDIYLWGDGVNYTTVTHTITYYATDCNGNDSPTKTENIIVTPRPQIIKIY
jgi:hypothetical protein